MYKPPVCRQAVPDEKFYPRSLAQHQARLRPLGTSCADAKLTCPGQIQITPHCAAASMPSADENFSRSGVVQGNKHCTHLRPGATFDKPAEASSLGNDNRNNLGHHTLARTFVPAPPLVRTTPATWGITYPPRPRPRFGASCAHTSQSSTDFSNRRLRRQAARPCVAVTNSERSKLVQSGRKPKEPSQNRTAVANSERSNPMENCRGRDGLCQAEPSVTNSERSKLVQNPASSRKCRRSWPDERLRIANRASCTERTSCSQERGGVSPPWSALRTRVRDAEIHRIAVAHAICKPTAG
jgi:hypothetical protein